MTQRKAGYYWVNFKGSWLIALFSPGYWWLCGMDKDYKETDFIEIGEFIESHKK